MVHEYRSANSITYKFLFWTIVHWRTYDDGGVDFYAFGKPCGETFIHRWMMR